MAAATSIVFRHLCAADGRVLHLGIAEIQTCSIRLPLSHNFDVYQNLRSAVLRTGETEMYSAVIGLQRVQPGKGEVP